MERNLPQKYEKGFQKNLESKEDKGSMQKNKKCKEHLK